MSEEDPTMNLTVTSQELNPAELMTICSEPIRFCMVFYDSKENTETGRLYEGEDGKLYYEGEGLTESAQIFLDEVIRLVSESHQEIVRDIHKLRPALKFVMENEECKNDRPSIREHYECKLLDIISQMEERVR